MPDLGRPELRVERGDKSGTQYLKSQKPTCTDTEQEQSDAGQHAGEDHVALPARHHPLRRFPSSDVYARL